jgi:hypothetical protein
VLGILRYILVENTRSPPVQMTEELKKNNQKEPGRYR